MASSDKVDGITKFSYDSVVIDKIDFSGRIL